MLATGIVPRSSVLVPEASGALATNGECQALLVCTGTMTVTPSTVTALWSDGPAPPRRLAAPAWGSARRRPLDCSSVINCRLAAGKVSLAFIAFSTEAGVEK